MADGHRLARVGGYEGLSPDRKPETQDGCEEDHRDQFAFYPREILGRFLKRDPIDHPP